MKEDEPKDNQTDSPEQQPPLPEEPSFPKDQYITESLENDFLTPEDNPSK